MVPHHAAKASTPRLAPQAPRIAAFLPTDTRGTAGAAALSCLGTLGDGGGAAGSGTAAWAGDWAGDGAGEWAGEWAGDQSRAQRAQRIVRLRATIWSGTS
jgi:hypothetical protein